MPASTRSRSTWATYLRLAYRAPGKPVVYTATLEQDEQTHSRELAQFDDHTVSPPVAQNVGAAVAHNGTYVARLNVGGAAPQPLGPLKQLFVQKGDTMTITAPGLSTRRKCSARSGSRWPRS